MVQEHFFSEMTSEVPGSSWQWYGDRTPILVLFTVIDTGKLVVCVPAHAGRGADLAARYECLEVAALVSGILQRNAVAADFIAAVYAKPELNEGICTAKGEMTINAKSVQGKSKHAKGRSSHQEAFDLPDSSYAMPEKMQCTWG